MGKQIKVLSSQRMLSLLKELCSLYTWICLDREEVRALVVRNILVIMDDYTRLTWVVSLVHTHEAFHSLFKFAKRVQNEKKVITLVIYDLIIGENFKNYESSISKL